MADIVREYEAAYQIMSDLNRVMNTLSRNWIEHNVPISTATIQHYNNAISIYQEIAREYQSETGKSADFNPGFQPLGGFFLPALLLISAFGAAAYHTHLYYTARIRELEKEKIEAIRSALEEAKKIEDAETRKKVQEAIAGAAKPTATPTAGLSDTAITVAALLGAAYIIGGFARRKRAS